MLTQQWDMKRPGHEISSRNDFCCFMMDWLCFGKYSLPVSTLLGSEVKALGCSLEGNFVCWDIFLPQCCSPSMYWSLSSTARTNNNSKTLRSIIIYHFAVLLFAEFHDRWMQELQSNCIICGPLMNYPELIHHFNTETQTVICWVECCSTLVFPQLQGEGVYAQSCHSIMLIYSQTLDLEHDVYTVNRNPHPQFVFKQFWSFFYVRGLFQKCPSQTRITLNNSEDTLISFIAAFQYYLP